MENVVIDGRYSVLAPLGAGGEARVFRAHDNTVNKEVALRLALRPGAKIIPAHVPEFVDGWVRLLDTGTDTEYGAYQVFELLEGFTLAQLTASGPLPAAEWEVFVEQSSEAVELLHAAGWIHGDLNAANFFRTNSGWKLLELPFLRFESNERSAVFGSIHTLAPEQIDGGQPNVQTDLYSLGCLYYHAASGEWPHPGANSQQVAIHCLRFAPESLANKSPQLRPNCSEAVMQMLAREPDLRPPSVAAARQLLGVA